MQLQIQLICWTKADQSLVHTTSHCLMVCSQVQTLSVRWRFQQKPLQFLMMQTDIHENSIWALCSDSRFNRIANGKVDRTIQSQLNKIKTKKIEAKTKIFRSSKHFFYQMNFPTALLLMRLINY